MADRTRKHSKRFRFWPGVIFPLGLTLLLVLAGWQFAVGVTAEQERRNAADDARIAAARRRAGELSGRAQTLSQAFIDSRLSSRDKREKDLRLEIRGVMEAVRQVLAASLERGRAQAVPRREVPVFPAGFKGVENYLALSRPDADAGLPLKALRSCAPELGEMLPAGYSLSVVEDNAVEIFAVGGDAPADAGLSIALNREFPLPERADGGAKNGAAGGKNWTLRVQLHAPDPYPLPDAAELARRLTDEMAGEALEPASAPDSAAATWRGWLTGADGQPAAVFPAVPDAYAAGGGAGPVAQPPPFIAVAREWRDVNGHTRVWLENGAPLSGVDLVPAVAVAVPQPGPPLDLLEEFQNDTRWICTLGALALGAAAFWIWFVRGMLGGGKRRLAELEAEVEALPVKSARKPVPGQAGARAPQGASAASVRGSSGSSAGAEAVAAELRRRLVRDGKARASSSTDVEDVIVADIGTDGGMTLSRAQTLSAALQQPVPAPAPRVPPLPSGSLFRLQAKHRGGKGRTGARALDRATHPVLKTLAARIRPVVGASAAAGSKVHTVRQDGAGEQAHG